MRLVTLLVREATEPKDMGVLYAGVPYALCATEWWGVVT